MEAISECPKATPWGPAQERDEVAPGIWYCSTASHGGFWLAPELATLMPECIRRNWFEEDCEWTILAVLFPAAMVRVRGYGDAWATCCDWQPVEYSLITGEFSPGCEMLRDMHDRYPAMNAARRERYPEAFAKWREMASAADGAG